MIQYLFMDVDGTLTDGKLNITKSKELYKSFNVKDGFGIKEILPEMNIVPIILTARKSKIVQRRAKELNIKHVYQLVQNKKVFLEEFLLKYKISSDVVAYIGDDINDIDCIKHVNLSACPSDAVDIVKKNVKLILKTKGGQGAVREFIDYIRKNCNSNEDF